MYLNNGPVQNFLRCKGKVSYQTTERAQSNFGTCMAVYTIRTVAIAVVEGLCGGVRTLQNFGANRNQQNKSVGAKCDCS